MKTTINLAKLVTLSNGLTAYAQACANRLAPGYVREQWESIGCLVEWAPTTGRIVIDRLPLRDCKAAKNCRNRYQVLSSDQSECWLFRSLVAASQFAKGLGDQSKESV
jgi:hypothetical protein